MTRCVKTIDLALLFTNEKTVKMFKLNGKRAFLWTYNCLNWPLKLFSVKPSFST